MKGLKLALGLASALFVSQIHAQTIFDNAPKRPPAVQQAYKAGTYTGETAKEAADTYWANTYVETAQSSSPGYDTVTNDGTSFSKNVGQYQLFYGTYSYCFPPDSNGHKSCGSSSSQFYVSGPETSKLCPPHDAPSFSYGNDEDLDGEIDFCYDPAFLDNASNCAADYNAGNILLGSSDSPPLTCLTDQQTGKSCAYSLKSTATNTYFYEVNLEQSCFGDANQVPEYDPVPSPQPGDNQCNQYAVGGYVCAADPQDYCDANGVCMDGCGYLEGQFVCFREDECTGPDCTPEGVNCSTNPDSPACQGTLPVNCTDNPNDPACSQPPTLENCESNPTLPGCLPVSGGGGSLSAYEMKKATELALDKLIDKDLTPDFKDIQDQIDAKTGELNEKIDGFMNDPVFGEMQAKIEEDLFGFSATIFPSGATCTPFAFGDVSLNLCPAFDKMRPFLYFIFAFLTLIYLRDLFFHTVTPTKE